MDRLSTQEVQKLHSGNIAVCTPKKYTESRGNPVMAFGDRLHEWREAAKMSLDDLADACGFSKSYIHRIEQNRVHPI